MLRWNARFRQNEVLKTCGYCGRENEDTARSCVECGTELKETPAAEAKPKARRRWPDFRLRYIGYAIALVLVYFLSFGPVMYYFSKVTSTSAIVGGTSTTSVTVELPAWAGIVYYPAVGLYTSDRGDATYGGYVRWWIQRREVKK